MVKTLVVVASYLLRIESTLALPRLEKIANQNGTKCSDFNTHEFIFSKYNSTFLLELDSYTYTMNFDVRLNAGRLVILTIYYVEGQQGNGEYQ